MARIGQNSKTTSGLGLAFKSEVMPRSTLKKKILIKLGLGQYAMSMSQTTKCV